MPSFVVLLIQWLVRSSACENLSDIMIWLWPLNISQQVDELLASVRETLLVFREFYFSGASDGLCSPYVLWPNNWELKIPFAGPGLFCRTALDSMTATRVSASTSSCRKICTQHDLTCSWTTTSGIAPSPTFHAYILCSSIYLCAALTAILGVLLKNCSRS